MSRLVLLLAVLALSVGLYGCHPHHRGPVTPPPPHHGQHTPPPHHY